MSSDINIEKRILHENSTLNITTKLLTNSYFSEFYWCFNGAGSSSTNACCTCGNQCSQSNWTTHLITKNTCDSCEYSCLLIVNPVSMKYNGGTFFTSISYFGRNATITIINITVIPQEHATVKQGSHLIYYLIGLGVGIIVAIFLAIGVIHHKSRSHQLIIDVEHYSGKQLFCFISTQLFRMTMKVAPHPNSLIYIPLVSHT